MTSWKTHGLCHGKTDLFFSTDEQKAKDAMKICHGCPVILICRQEGRGEFGVWGGGFGGAEIHLERIVRKSRRNTLERRRSL